MNRFLGRVLRALMRLGLVRPILTDDEWQMARTLRALGKRDSADMLIAPMSTAEAIRILKAGQIPLAYEQK